MTDDSVQVWADDIDEDAGDRGETADGAGTAVYPDDVGWSDRLTQGELRLLSQHLEAANARLARAYDILDDAGALEAYREGDEGAAHTFADDLTTAASRTEAVTEGANLTYTERRRSDE